MILSVFLLVSLFFFFVKDQIASFQLKHLNHCVFELSVPCVYIFHFVIATEFNRPLALRGHVTNASFKQ